MNTTLTVDIGSVCTGREISIPINSVCNNGQFTIDGVLVQLDSIPSGLQYSTAILPQGTWNDTTDTWEVGTLTSGQCVDGEVFFHIIDEAASEFIFEFSITTTAECDVAELNTHTITATGEICFNDNVGLVNSAAIVIPQGSVDFEGNFTKGDEDCPLELAQTFEWLSTNQLSGTISGTPDAFTYTPDPSFCGQEFARYGMYCNGNLVDEGIAVFNITCACADIDEIFIEKNTATNGTVATNDCPCMYGAITKYELVSNPVADGAGLTEPTSDVDVIITTWSLDNGTFTVLPSNDFLGDVTFEYVVSCYDAEEVFQFSTPNIIVTVHVGGPGDYAIARQYTNVETIGFLSNESTPCYSGITTYEKRAGTEVNCTAAVDVNGRYDVEITDFTLAWSFEYSILCDGVEADFASVSGGPITYSPPFGALSYSGREVTGAIGLSTSELCSEGETYYGATGVLSNISDIFMNIYGYYSVTVTDITLPWSFEYKAICKVNGIEQIIDTATVSGDAITATANDDATVAHITPTYAGDVSTNDTPCSSGTTTYELITASEVNGSVSLNPVTGQFVFFPHTGDVWSFQYNIVCNGVVLDSATVTGEYS